MRFPFDIVAYSYEADLWCPACIARHFDGPDSSATHASAEGILDRAAHHLGIDRYDESSYDSGEFPKVVLRDYLEDYDCCGQCLEVFD